jgi:hypothetical protein
MTVPYPINCYYSTESSTGLPVGQRVWEFSDNTLYVAEDVSIQNDYKICKGKQIVLSEHPGLLRVIQVAGTPSYHDVDVYLDDVKHNIFNSSYGLQLTCTRAAGWEVWNKFEGEEELLAGEFNPKCRFRLVIRGVCIADNRSLFNQVNDANITK